MAAGSLIAGTVALFRLARPRLLPYVLGLVLLGFAWAHWDRALTLRGGEGIVWVLLAWTALHAGTLWLNAALDQDEGEVLFGRPVRPPAGTSIAAYVALALTVPLAWFGHPLAGVAGLVCALLAVGYSHPRLAWKGHPLGGPVVNIVGYGLLSPLAGWAVVAVPPDPRTVLVWILFALAIFGTYLAAQAFQQDEDRGRGYRTLVATHGPRVVLQGARITIGIAMIGGLFLAAIGWLPRICLVGVVGWGAVDRQLSAWANLPNGGTEADARGFATRMLFAALLGIVLALGQYTVDSLSRRPVAGLGTVAGHPPDTPIPQRIQRPATNHRMAD